MVVNYQHTVKLEDPNKALTRSFITELNKIFTGSEEPLYDNGWLFHVPSDRKTMVFYKILHNFRLLDTMMKVTLLKQISKNIDIPPDELESYETKVRKVFQLYDNHTKHLLKADINKSKSIAYSVIIWMYNLLVVYQYHVCYFKEMPTSFQFSFVENQEIQCCRFGIGSYSSKKV